MPYRSLKSIFHEFDNARAETEEQNRRSSPSALHWRYKIGDHQMFAVVTTEIVLLLQSTMSTEREALALWRQLPHGVQINYLHSMIVEEIQASNEIEHVHASRQEIAEAIESLAESDPARSKRFGEMVRLYVAMGEQRLSEPSDLDDIRSLYDEALAGETRDKDLPDGARFRAGPVYITSGTRTVHSGVMPESAIDAGLSAMLDQSVDSMIPQLIRAVAGHFIFEHVHPFYDGNGRMGRLLLALDLGHVLSPVAWLSLSATISDHKERYYRAFADSEHPLGRGDTTVFVETMLSIIDESLSRLLKDLTTRSDQLHGLRERMVQLPIPSDGDSPSWDPEQADDLRTVLFILGQVSLFSPTGVITLDELALSRERSKQFVRPLTLYLERIGLIETVSKRPLRFRLSRQGGELLGLTNQIPWLN